MKVRKTRALVLFFVSLVCAIAGTPLMAILALKAKYVLLCIMIPIVGHGYYGIPLYLIAYRHNKVFIRISELITDGITSKEELRDKAKLSDKGINYFLSKMEKKGYLDGCVIQSDATNE